MPRSDCSRQSSHSRRPRPTHALETTALLRAARPPDRSTSRQRQEVRRVAGPIPISVTFIFVMELCERATFYGLLGPLQNYIVQDYHDRQHHGALGLGRAAATNINLGFQVLCYLSPIPGAIIADQYIGRYKTVRYSSLLYIVGLCVLFVTSIPFYRNGHLGLVGLVVSLVLIALGSGGIKSSLAAWVADQYPEDESAAINAVHVRGSRTHETEFVVIDRKLALARAFLAFYTVTQFGSLLNLFTTPLEARHGFPSAFLVPLPIFVLGFLTLLLLHRSIIQIPPQRSPLFASIQDLFRTRKAPDDQSSSRSSKEISQALKASGMFFFIPISLVCQLQARTNLISQAARLENHGITSTTLLALSPFVVTFLAPVLDLWIYPFLQRRNLRPGPVARMTAGFFCNSVAMAYAAALQSELDKHTQNIYLCQDGRPCKPNVHVEAQIPAYVLAAISELFTVPAGLEWAASRAPESIRSFMVALFMMTFAGSAALATLLSSLARDSHSTSMYVILSVGSGLAGLVFWPLFGNERSDTRIVI